jgi:hypothetical protein
MAVAAIRDADGMADYSWEWRDMKRIPGGGPWAPRWLVDRFGVDYFGHVTAVRFCAPQNFGAPETPLAAVGSLNRLEVLIFDGQNLWGARISNLRSLKNLKALQVSSCLVTDDQLSCLKELRDLRSLDLSYNPRCWDSYQPRCTGALLVHIEGLRRLSHLNLNSCAVTDSALSHIEGLTELTSLHLAHTRITDSGLQHLQSLTKMTILVLEGDEITDVGLRSLKHLRQLEELALNETQITGAGLVYLEGMSKLRSLDLRRTAVDDKALQHIKTLASLVRLNIGDTRVSRMGASELARAMPRVEISY